MTQQSGRERVLRALSTGCGPVPWLEFIVDPDIASKIVGHAITPIGKSIMSYPDQVEFAQAVGIDGIYIVAYERFGVDIEETAQSYRYVGRVKGRDDLRRLEIPEVNRQAMEQEVDRARQAVGDSGLAIHPLCIFCVADAMQDAGFENFLNNLHDDPAFISELLAVYEEYNTKLLDIFSSLTEVDFIWVADDIAYNAGLFFSPRTFHELVMPMYRRMAAHIKKPWAFHSDGNITEVLDDLLSLGMNAIHPLQPDAMNIHDIKKRYGNRVCLIGNVDLRLLATGTPEQVESCVLDLAQLCALDGRYILSSGNSIPKFLKPENVMAMGRAIQTFNKENFE